MIIVRLVLHRRNIQSAIGASTGTTGVYTAIITMIIESYTPYAITLIIYLGSDANNTLPEAISSPLLGNAQVWFISVVSEAAQFCILISSWLWAGHRPTSCRFAGRQSEGIDE